MPVNQLAVVCIATVLVASTQFADAQSAETYRGRLSPVPIDFKTAPTTTGSGLVTATLSGNTLTIAGTFDGLNSAATAAHVHRAPKGMRGPRAFDLTVTKATKGTVEGRLTLTAAQVQDLKQGWYLVQIHTENNPDGHLRTWLAQQK
jgi:hypothetical protein